MLLVCLCPLLASEGVPGLYEGRTPAEPPFRDDFLDRYVAKQQMKQAERYRRGFY